MNPRADATIPKPLANCMMCCTVMWDESHPKNWWPNLSMVMDKPLPLQKKHMSVTNSCQQFQIWWVPRYWEPQFVLSGGKSDATKSRTMTSFKMTLGPFIFKEDRCCLRSHVGQDNALGQCHCTIVLVLEENQWFLLNFWGFLNALNHMEIEIRVQEHSTTTSQSWNWKLSGHRKTPIGSVNSKFIA